MKPKKKKKVIRTKRLTPLELKKLTKALEKLEAPMYRCYKKISGGFSEAKMFDYDDDFIDVEFRFGYEDCGDGSNIHSETYKIDRATMEIID
jgi:hypothetical protein